MKKSMKKLLALVAATTMLAASLTACGGSANDNGAGNTPAGETPAAEAPAAETPASDEAPAATGALEPCELTVWESTGGPDEFIQQAAKAFEEKNPGVTVKFVNVELGDSVGQIALDGPAGVGADVFAAPHDKLGELVLGGHILGVSDPAYVQENALGACSSAVTYDGTVYGYPVASETYGLFYNKALISDDQVPKTWEDLIAYGKSFNEAGKFPFVMDVTSGYYTILFTTANGNRLFGAEGTDSSSTYLNNADAVAGMKLFQSLKEIINVPASDMDTAQADGAFSSGSAAMHITGPWNIKNFLDAGIELGVTSLPSLSGDSPAASFSGTRTMFVSAYSNYPTQAQAFAEFLMTPEMQQLRYEITGAIPSIDIAVDSPYINGLIKQLDYAFPMPSLPEMSKFWDTMSAASKNIWDGADAQTELDACNAAILAQ